MDTVETNASGRVGEAAPLASGSVPYSLRPVRPRLRMLPLRMPPRLRLRPQLRVSPRLRVIVGASACAVAVGVATGQTPPQITNT